MISLKQLLRNSCFYIMPNQYVAFIAIEQEGQKREDGLRTGELRIFWKNEEGLSKNHSPKSLHKYELEEMMNQLGYQEDRILMKKDPVTYEASMRAMIEAHFEDHVELIKSGQKIEEVLSVVVVTPDVTLQEAVEKHKSESESSSEAEKKEESIENDNNTQQESATVEEVANDDEETEKEEEDLDIE
jgi:hypothetical protein